MAADIALFPCRSPRHSSHTHTKAAQHALDWCISDAPKPAWQTGIIRFLHCNEKYNMEAEQLNSISNKLDDLAQRADELRRYL